MQPLIFVTYKKHHSLDIKDATCLAFSRSGDFLAVACGKRATIWSITTGEMTYFVDGNSRTFSLFWDLDDILYCGFDDGMCAIVRIDDRRGVRNTRQ